MTSEGNKTFGYNDADELTSMVVPDQTKSAFVYDSDGRKRISTEYTWDANANDWTQSDQTRYVYDGMNLVQEQAADGTVKASFVRDGNIGGVLSMTNADGTFDYHYDGNGNVVALTDASQNIVAQYSYDAYGNLLSSSGSEADKNPFRFSSKYYDADTGLYDYGFRHYDSLLGRWINRDPIGVSGGLNLYGFVGNNPGNSLDAYGLFELWLETTEVKPGFHHSFLVLHDEDGKGKPIATYFGGAPQFNIPSEFVINGFGNVTCETSDFTNPWNQTRKERAKRTSMSMLISAPGKSGKVLRNRLYKVMSKIEKAGVNYNPVLGPNSNSVTRAMLEVGIGMHLGNAKTVTTQLGIWALSGWDTRFPAGTFGGKN